MYIPGPGQESTAEDTANVMLNKNEYFGFCKSFKYLGTNFVNSMNDSEEIITNQRQIGWKQAFRGHVVRFWSNECKENYIFMQKRGFRIEIGSF